MTRSAVFPCVAPLGGRQTVSFTETTHSVPPRRSARARSGPLPEKFLIVLMVGLLGAAGTEPASADLIAYDQFVGYDAGQLVGQGKGSGWGDVWENRTEYGVSDSDGLTHSSLSGVTAGGSASTGTAGGGVWRDLATPPASPGTYYFGFLMKASGNAHNAVVGLVENDDGTGNILYSGSWNSQATWRMAERDGADYSDRDTHIAETGNTTLFVVKLYLRATSPDSAALYVNPADAAALSAAPNAEYSYVRDFSQVSMVRAAVVNQGASNGSFIFDEIRIGTEAADMFSTVPEPMSLALLALGGLVTVLRRR